MQHRNPLCGRKENKNNWQNLRINSRTWGILFPKYCLRGYYLYIKRIVILDIDELITGIKERGAIVRDPLRVRRKRSKGRREGGLWKDSPKGKASLRDADRRYWRSVSGRWRQLKKEYGRRGKQFDITLEEWKQLWKEAGGVQIGEKWIPLFSLRGRGKEAVKVYRIDWDKGWVLDNVVIMYKGAIRANGRNLVGHGKQ